MLQRKVNPYTLFKLYNLDFCSRIQAKGTLGKRKCHLHILASFVIHGFIYTTHSGFVLKCNPWLYNSKVKKKKPICPSNLYNHQENVKAMLFLNLDLQSNKAYQIILTDLLVFRPLKTQLD